MFSCLRHTQNFFQRGGTNFSHIFRRIFSRRITLKHSGNKKTVGESRGVLPRKFFENLHAVVAILVFLNNFCLNFLPLNLSVSPNIMYFVCTFSITRALGERQRLIVTEKVRNYGDIAFINNMFQNGWWGMHLPPPLPALITMSLTTTLISRFGFSMM